MTRCGNCRCSLAGRRKGTKFCGDACRSEAWKAKRDGQTARHAGNGSCGASGHPGARPPTRYAILEGQGLTFRVIGFEQANKAAQAVRKFGMGDRAISARLLGF